ncbi:hypothetical protein SAMN03159463_04062 [Mesorhizobium sp. NFR06]|uniref:hypothetical protein n=1 Tax=Mesorhizobium sp. NFR06 TaxID=1566290 RepID=UPI0008EBB449|nr:hypothetical protein [Mesorhizobium sp. NFR06]SFP35216.1 hypothetical protein SAMN03159463_04062 [Mesorhizobium sp. NFR06]
MLKTTLAASVLTVGLATAALAQSAGHMGSGNSTGSSSGTGSGQTVVPNPDAVDPGTTGSIYGGPLSDYGMNSNADRNCPASPQGAQPDANHLSPGTAAPTVNDKNCGK